MNFLKRFLANVQRRDFAPVDIASLVFFRLVFGLLMIWEVWLYWSHDWIGLFWIKPRFLFKFYGFSWVQPWPGNGLYIHWAVLGVLALFITVGFLYRASTALFFVGLTYVFLLDEAQYLSHFYLLCLFSFLLIFVPAHRAFSVDAWLRPKLRSQMTPAWALWLLRFQIGAVYFFSGLGKLLPDWLHGELMRSRLARQTDFPIIGRFFREEWAVYTMSYGALLFDLFIVPFLLWRRTRVAAFCVAFLFNLLNARLFNIYVFPWLSIAATALFFSPGWPRRVLSVFNRKRTVFSTGEVRPPTLARQRLVLTLLFVYVALQLLVPLRHFLYRGGIEWTLQEHRFTWRMMLVGQRMRAFFYVTDPNTGETLQVSPADLLSPRQANRMAWRPDMVLQFAHYLAKIMPRSGPKALRVEARVFVSLNGRKPQLFVNPSVDLAAEPRTFGRPHWLLEVHEPLPPPQKEISESSFAPISGEN
jgi:vitamin K-dependent gamma-carboxylase